MIRKNVKMYSNHANPGVYDLDAVPILALVTVWYENSATCMSAKYAVITTIFYSWII